MYSIERLPPRELDTSCIKDPFDNTCVEFMMNSNIYKRSFDYRSQCHNAFMIMKTFKWSVCKVSKLFGVDHKAFEKQLSLQVEQRENGRLPSLSDKEQQI